ncbi:hypothetical protein [Mesorhizobium sp.]|uniref:hypothetical protein n=1 Tax=Mesorhizobium sp. TaxID=1871066 RepID=UPI0012048A7D|nr:hypothetical protein [Mesorhizobium sp.]TIV61892.1 MAG: hypothetical protein E5V80_02910 [Mesorhizobium sp.]
MSKSPKQITPIAGNILSIARSKEEQAKAVAESATSYMPTNINVDRLMAPSQPERDAHTVETATVRTEPKSAGPRKGQRKPDQAEKGAKRDSVPAATRKRVSLYLEDDVLFKIFKVSMERHEQLSSATHRLILEALEARGL